MVGSLEEPAVRERSERGAVARLTAAGLQVPGLEPVSLTVSSGECVSLSGPSGSGKSLILRALADLDPRAGELALDGTPRTEVSGPNWRRAVRYFAAESGWWGGRVRDHFRDQGSVGSSLDIVGLPADAADWQIDRLSSGERQRLALLRGLEDGPRVLLLDEPTGALDEDTRDLVETLIMAKRAGGTAVLLVSHDRGQIARLADRGLEIRGGCVETTP